MRKLLAILLCKIGHRIGGLFGRGSSLPGKYALKICPDILSRVRMPEYSIGVSGSNGKTSTVEMMREMLEKAGLSVACNYEGSNQIEGVTTMILDNCTLFGRFRKDVLLMEIDERYAKYIFHWFSPKYFVINNLYRDQMTRNGHPEYVMKDIRKAIPEGSTLVLNADDPLIASLGEEFANETVYFGIEDNPYVSKTPTSVYNDGYYCPVCKQKMVYDYCHFGHVGKYHCTSCDFERPAPAYAITDIDMEKGEIVINDRCHVSLALHAIHNAYNVLAAFTVGSLMGLKDETMADSLNNYLIRNGRVRRFKTGGRTGTLLISKHENTTSYDNNLQYICSQNRDVQLLLIIDDISRKYFTSDTSWLWDIRFDLLKNEKVKEVVVAGKYTDDVAVRLENAGVDMDKVFLTRYTADALTHLQENVDGELFVMTCFSDEGKLLKEVEVL